MDGEIMDLSKFKEEPMNVELKNPLLLDKLKLEIKKKITIN